MYDYGITDYGVDSAFNGLFAGFMAFAIVILIIVLIFAIMQIIGSWKILSKANQPGWAILIPFYGQYVLCKAVGVNPWWILIVLCSSILNVIPIIGSLASIAISLYFLILLNVSLARSYGKEDSFAIGLILLPPIFTIILGFGNSEYQGPKPMNDIVFEKINKNNNQQQVTPNTNNNSNTNENTDNNTTSYCPSCGASVDSSTRYCPNCGNEIK